jgi:Transglycosylase SLT domain
MEVQDKSVFPHERRRLRDRRQAERRAVGRGGPDRRQGDRRAAARTGLILGALLAAASVPRAEAQIYTRTRGRVVEATNIPGGKDFKLTYVGKGTLIHSRGFLRRSNNHDFDSFIVEAAATHNVDTELIRAVIQVESEFDHLAVSSKGARGLMQLMPDTARRLGVANAFDPRQNILGGTRYLRLLLNQFSGDTALATAAYNAGENAVFRYGGIPPFKETRGYVAKIQALLGAVTSGVQAALSVPASLLTPPAFYTPGGPSAPAEPARAARTTVPAKMRVLYKWKDPAGVWNVTQNPPPGGVPYTIIRAVD